MVLHDFNRPSYLSAATVTEERMGINSGPWRDKPILKLLTQIAVEVFAKQSTNKLQMCSKLCDAAHYAVVFN